MSEVTIHFLGAANTVTGSKYLIKTSEITLLIDCGLFQGKKELREQNWDNLNIDVPAIDYVLLTHGHLDHVGYLPRLVNQGFRGKIYGTEPTLEIARIILFDSAKIQEEDAEKANLEGFSKHHPALPLYSVSDVENTIGFFVSEPRDTWITINPDIKFRYRYNGHILGATFIEMDISGKRFVFSGDIGREEDLLLYKPERPEKADYLFLESTYGDTLHPKEDVLDLLEKLIKQTINERGTLIIPSFAVERTQTLMIILWRMFKKNRIPNIPLYVDTPMGEQVLDVFFGYKDWHKIELNELKAMLNHVNVVESYRETWQVIDYKRPKIVIAGSGMVTGGRVLTYLQQLIDESSTTILLVGFQAEGTRGRDLQDGASEIKFFGKFYPVKARIEFISSLSAHADQQELLNWISELQNTPETIFLVHGEPNSLEALKTEIESKFNYHISIPSLYEIVKLEI